MAVTGPIAVTDAKFGMYFGVAVCHGLIAAIALGIVGVVAKGLLYLLIIGVVVFLGAVLLAGLGCGDDRPGARPDDLRSSSRHACPARMADPTTELA